MNRKQFNALKPGDRVWVVGQAVGLVVEPSGEQIEILEYNPVEVEILAVDQAYRARCQGSVFIFQGKASWKAVRSRHGGKRAPHWYRRGVSMPEALWGTKAEAARALLRKLRCDAKEAKAQLVAAQGRLVKATNTLVYATRRWGGA